MNFKSKRVEENAKFVHSVLWAIIVDADNYVFEKYGIRLTIVETGTTKEEDEAVGRVEPMHRERPARAVDVRTFDVAKEILDDLEKYLMKKYGHLGAISRSNNQRDLIIDKPHGTGPHWHVQIQRGLDHEVTT